MLTLLFACEEPEKPAPVGGDGPSLVLAADASVALPYASAGGAVPDGSFTIRDEGGGGSDGQVRVITPEFVTVEGSTAPLGRAEARAFTVRFAGDAGRPGLYTGSIEIAVDHDSAYVTVAAVVGDAALPAATWTDDAWGARTTIPLPSAPFPDGDASVLVFVPTSLSDADGIGTVTHLHGHNATLSEVVAAQHLVEQHALSGRDAVLIVPQGPVEQASSDFGRLDEADGHATLVRDVISVLYRDGIVTWPALGGVAITAHSGGYAGTAAIVTQGGIPVDAVHLFDALYGEADTFAAFAQAGGVLRSSYTDFGGTDDNNEELAEELAEELGEEFAVGDSFTDDALAATRVTIGRVDSAHGECVSVERSFARWLAASGLPSRPAAPVELLAVISDGGVATVTWRPDADPVAARVEGSDDGVAWTLLLDTNASEAVVPAKPWIRVVKSDVAWGDSEPSDIYGGSGADWLVVDGFDRVLDGSWTGPTHDFAAIVGNALGAPFSVASNEAVAAGAVALSDYAGVVWMLGDEGVADRTFDASERAAVAAYVEGGGRLIVSGSEVGYATDADWLEDVLHATYVSDDAGTIWVDGWTLGSEYDEDYPDVLAGEEVVWSYGSGAAAAVGWDRRVVVVGFGIENIAEASRAEAIQELAEWLR